MTAAAPIAHDAVPGDDPPTIVIPTGTGIVNVTAVAADGPLLATDTVYVTPCPTNVDSGTAVAATDTSASSEVCRPVAVPKR